MDGIILRHPQRNGHCYEFQVTSQINFSDQFIMGFINDFRVLTLCCKYHILSVLLICFSYKVVETKGQFNGAIGVLKRRVK